MKTIIKNFLLSKLILCALFLPLITGITKLQAQIPEISFIKLNDKIGIVIDSAENEQCKCISYYDKEEYKYSALVQLPDKSVILRIVLAGSLGTRDIIMNKTDIDKLYSSALSITSPTSAIDSVKEEEIMRAISGDTVLYKRINYKMLNFVTGVKPWRNTFYFFNAGMGLSGKLYNSYYKSISIDFISFGLEPGIIYKNNILSFRYFYLTDVPMLSEARYVNHFALLLGRKFDMGRVALSFSVGVSRLSFNSNYNAYGFPIQMEIFLGANRSSHFSLIFYSDITPRTSSVYNYYNPKISANGFLICMRFGSIRNRVVK